MRAYDLETDEKIFDDSTDMLMCILDPVRKNVGVTDDEGKIVLVDRTLFPQLYERDPMTANDEGGEPMGVLQPTDTMIITLADTTNGGGMTFKREVPGPVDIELVWKPVVNPVWAPGDRGGYLVQERDDPPMPPGPTPVFRLGPVSPNPFN